MLRSARSALPEPAHTSRLHELVGFQIRRVNTESMGALTARLAAFGLRVVHFSAMAAIAEQPGIVQNALGRRLVTKPGNMVPIMNELMRKGLVAREPSDVDRRAFHLRLTPAGGALLGELDEVVAAHEDSFLAPLDPAERATLMRLLLRLGDGAPAAPRGDRRSDVVGEEA